MFCRSCDPLDLQRLAFDGDLWFVLVNPCFEAPTAEMRAVLPKEIPMKQVRPASACMHACPPSLLAAKKARLGDGSSFIEGVSAGMGL